MAFIFGIYDFHNNNNNKLKQQLRNY